jgi:glycosyltransferase involved in cell wall biosynthesis
VNRPNTYDLVSPVRDEEANLARLAESLVAQTVRPRRWLIVDNGSRDGTAALVAELAAAHPWVSFLSVPGDRAALPGQPVVRAFHAGVAELDELADVVVKLDADVSMEPDHFERLLRAFRGDETLGIAGGICLELVDGEWLPVHTTAGHVRGAVRAYRRECLLEILPLPEAVGWDGIDALKAQVAGWTTRTLDDIPFYHHRKLGARDGGRTRRWRAQGRGAYYMGYRLSYLVARATFHARRDPAALTMITSCIGSALHREERYGDSAVRAHLRKRQSLRHLLSRFREAQGRVPAS